MSSNITCLFHHDLIYSAAGQPLAKKGFPRFVLQSNHPIQPTICAGAEAAQSRPKEKKQMPITADRQKRRSLATAASTGNRPPSSETPKRRYQPTPPRRDVTMATLLPRVSPSTQRGERKGSPDALQEGPAAPSGATASVSAKPTGISPDPILHLRHSGARHQTDHHPAPTRT